MELVSSFFAESLQNFYCEAGYGILTTGSCQICPPGSYSDGTTGCYSVPSGYYNPYYGQSNYSLPCEYATESGAVVCESASSTCDVGEYYNVSTGLCANVPIGTYNPNPYSSIYYYCAYSTFTGAATCSQAVRDCSIGEYDDGTQCSLAPVGYYSPNVSSGIYYNCDYSKHLGASNCLPNTVVCSPYSTSNATFAKRNYGVCNILACPGAKVTASGCGTGNGGASTNDQYLQVLLNGVYVADNDDYCGYRSQVTFTVNSSSTSCKVYSLHEGCYQNVACIGNIKITGAANCPVGTYYYNDKCNLVPTGYYNPDVTSGTYYRCEYSLLAGAANCVGGQALNCSAGEYYNTTSSSCVPVPAGFYNPISGSNVYYYCGSPLLYKAGLESCYTPTPSVAPTHNPTAPPTLPPTDGPTEAPTAEPSYTPTFRPTAKPSGKPTRLPSARPTTIPTETGVPSIAPTSFAPTVSPTTSKPTSAQPTVSPTSSQPTVKPTASPSTKPSTAPTTSAPTRTPTSSAPSAAPIGPSIKPTAAPSSLSPTPIPSTQPTVSPTLNSRTVSVTLSNITYDSLGRVRTTVSFYPLPSVKGSVYCAKFYQNVSVGSVSQILAYNNSVAYDVNASSITATVPGFEKFFDYYLYCIAVTSSGTSLPITSAVTSRASFSITCCKDLYYTSIYESVYGDYSIYSLLNEQIYFQVEMSHLPSEMVTLIPTLSFANGTLISSQLLQVVPNSMTFFSNSSTRDYSFYIDGSSELAADVVLTMLLVGNSAAEFNSISNQTIEILSLQTPIAPPQISSAIYSSLGVSIIVTFDSYTDFGGILSTEWNCTLLLQFNDDNYATCLWTAPDELTIVFSTGRGANVGSQLALKGGILGAACPNSLPCTVSSEKSSYYNTSILAPTDPIEPSIVLIIPGEVSICDGFSIDASMSYGNGGRSWSVVNWTVSTSNSNSISNAIAMMQILNNADIAKGSISIPSSNITAGKYCVELKLTNFLGSQSKKQECVVVSESPIKPTVILPGGSNLTVYVFNALSIQADVSLPSCANSETTLSYFWSIASSTGTLLSISSTSINPSRFLLPAHSLQSGSTYIVTLLVTTASTFDSIAISSNATVSIAVSVLNGKIIAAIYGGYLQNAPIDQLLILNASSSYDQDSPTTSLVYSWSCQNVAAGAMFGSQCNYIFSSTYYGSSALEIYPYSMSLTDLYAITVVVSDSTDSTRKDSKTVYVTPIPTGSPRLSIFGPSAPLKLSSKVYLYATIQMGNSSELICNWESTYNGLPVNLTNTLTPTRYDFFGRNADYFTTFLMFAQQFVNGRSYKFSLSCCRPSDQTCYSSTMTIKIAGVPYGGSLNINPPSGRSLIDSFTINSVGWLANEVEMYPFLYSFTAQSYPGAPILTVQTSSLKSSVTCTLPPGVQSYNYQLSVTGFVVDALGGVANSSSTVTVVKDASVNLGLAFQNSVSSFLTSFNTGSLMQSINSVSSLLSLANCSLSPDCSGINREECTTVSHTCGECIRGYSGISGHSNVPCVNASLGIYGRFGDTCNTDVDCIYGHCRGNICSALPTACPASSLHPALECSGHGTCILVDISGNIQSNCTILDTHCSSECICFDGFGGEDCSLNATALAYHENLRSSMCYYQSLAMSYQDPSGDLIGSMSGALSTTFSATEVLSSEAKSNCIAVLDSLTSLCSAGYLSDAPDYTPSTLVQLVSSFSKSNWSFALGNTTNSSVSSSVLSPIMTALADSFQRKLIPGQDPITIASDNLRIQVGLTPMFSGSTNLTLSPPATAAESNYGLPLPSISASPFVLDICGVSLGYVKSTIAQWGKNPNPNSAMLSSPLLQTAIGEQSVTSSAATISDVPIYFVTIQYIQSVAFDERAYTNRYANRTIPECSYHNGVSYISCSHCNISVFTDTNVTYACYDASVICSRNSLSNSNSNSNSNRRYLLGTNVEIESTDDKSDSSEGIATYGMIVTALVGELADVLSINPFAIDLNKAKSVLIFVGLLTFALVFGIIIFTIWDARDHNRLEYVQAERVRLQMEKEKQASSRNSQAFHYQLRMQEKKKQDKLARKKFYKDIAKSFRFRTVSTGEKITNLLFGSTSESDALKPKLSSDSNDGVKVSDLSVGLTEEGTDDDDLSSAQDDRMLEGQVAIYDFFDVTIPPRTFLDAGNIVRRYINSLLLFHPYLCMLSAPSCVTTRTLRWLSVMRGILISLFIDTLFFGIFYPSDNTCTVFATSTDCLATPSKVVAGSSLCNWNEANEYCSLNPPPQDMNFTIVLAFMTVLLVIPTDLVFGFIMDEYGARRPRLEKWGWNGEYWLGTNTVSFKDGRHESFRRQPMQTTLFSRVLRESPLSPFIKAILVRSDDSFDFEDIEDDLLTDVSPKMFYFDFCTPEEEVRYIIRKVRQFWMVEMQNPFSEAGAGRLLQQSNKQDNHTKAGNEAKANAFMDILHVYPNGGSMPLSFFQWLVYGTAHHKIMHLVSNARERADDILQELKEMERLGMQNSIDVFLIQHFIMEQMGSLTRFALSKQMFNYSNELAPFPIDAWKWLLAWGTVSLLFLFFLYWIFAWGVTNGGDTMLAWGINFGIGTVQDFLVVQPLKILILYILSVEAARPQLRVIHRRLIHLATQLQQSFHVHTDDDDMNHTAIYDDFNVVHHRSGSCRAARMSNIGPYPAAFLLRHVTDLDIQSIREGKKWSFGTLVFVIIVVPALVGLFSDLAVDGVMETILPSLLAGFVVFNNALYRIHPILVIVPYVLFFGIVWYFFGLLRPSAKKAEQLQLQRIQKISKLHSHHKKTNNNSNKNKTKSRNSKKKTKRAHLTNHKGPRAELQKMWTEFNGRLSLFIIHISRPLFPDFVKNQLKLLSGSSNLLNLHNGIRQSKKPSLFAPRISSETRDRNWKFMNLPHNIQGKTLPLPARHSQSLSSPVSSPQKQPQQQQQQQQLQQQLLLRTNTASVDQQVIPVTTAAAAAVIATAVEDEDDVVSVTSDASVEFPESIRLLVTNNKLSIQDHYQFLSNILNRNVYSATSLESQLENTSFADERKIVTSRPRTNLALQKLDYMTSAADALQHIFMNACYSEGVRFADIRQFPLITDLTAPSNPREDEIRYKYVEKGSNSSNNSDYSDEWNTISIPIKFSEERLSEILSNFWEVYLPGGFQLSQFDIDMIKDDFHFWASNEYKRTVTKTRYISIFRFAEWYLSYVEDVIRTKHILQGIQLSSKERSADEVITVINESDVGDALDSMFGSER